MVLDDLVVPDTAASAAALEVASAYQSPALVNHSLRAYLWAAAHGMTRGIGFDPELLYVAALFHDLGLVPAFDSYAVSFEEAAMWHGCSRPAPDGRRSAANAWRK